MNVMNKRASKRRHPLLAAFDFFGRTEEPSFHCIPAAQSAAPAAKKHGNTASPGLTPLPRKRLVLGKPHGRVHYADHGSIRHLRRQRTLKWHRQAHNARTPKIDPSEPATFEQLEKEVQSVVCQLTPASTPLSGEERIFLQQLGCLTVDRGFRKELVAAREEIERGARDAPRLNAERDARAARAVREHQAKLAARQAERQRFDEINQRREREAAILREQVARDEVVRKAAMRRGAAALRIKAEREMLKREKDLREREAALHREEEARRAEALRLEEESRQREAERREARRLKEEERLRVAELEEAKRRHLQGLRLAEEERRREAELKELKEAMQRREEAIRLEEARKREAEQEALRQQQEAHRLREEARQRAVEDERLRLEALQHSHQSFEQRRSRLQQKYNVEIQLATAQGRPFAPHEADASDQLVLYEMKWDDLRNLKGRLPPIHFIQIPWPVLQRVENLSHITYAAVHEFVFHESRPGMEGKTKRERLKPEILRWHPDKFRTGVLPMVVPHEASFIMEGADLVVRILTQLMELP